MKRFFVVIALFAFVFTAGTALATVVDFSVLGINTVDITTPNSLTLDGVTFLYDDFGSGTDFANADAFGLFGSTWGELIFNFLSPAQGLSFDFLVSDANGLVPGSVFAQFNTGNSVSVPSGTLTYGTLAGGSPVPVFNQVAMFFSPVSGPPSPYLFSVGNITYDPAPVPEPGTIVLLTSGLLGLVGLRGWRFFGLKC